MSSENIKQLQYIYKILPEAPPNPLPGALPPSELDRNSGFIHMSTSVQLLNTLTYFFGSSDVVGILRVPYEPISKKVRWESPDAKVCGPRGGEGMFPHIYNGLKLGTGEVEAVGVWKREEDETWQQVIKREEEKGWLLY